MTKRLITVNGGAQLRPHLNMKDLVDCIKRIVSERIYGTFNLACANQSVLDTAKLVQFIAGGDIEIKPATDNRNYSVQSSFPTQFTVANAVSDLTARFKSGYWKDISNKSYENQL
jgi:nucleoside-diphosphate-sugar epimerase